MFMVNPEIPAYRIAIAPMAHDPGEPWQEAFVEALDASSTVAVFIAARQDEPMAQRGDA